MATHDEKEINNNPLPDEKDKSSTEEGTNRLQQEQIPGQTKDGNQSEKKSAANNSFKSSDSNNSDSIAPGNVNFILDIPLEITVELGRTEMLVSDLLKLNQGSVVPLSKIAGETLEILANQKLIARGEVVVVKDKYGIRLTEIVSPSERVEKLK